MAIPEFLYRGDDDADRKRIHGFWERGFLVTNLADSGVGREVFSAPLRQLVVKHVTSSWPKTHFLSFTSDRSVAEGFARGRPLRPFAPLPADSRRWDTAILTLATSDFAEIECVAPGFYRGTYQVRPILRPGADPFLFFGHAISREVAALPLRTILLIDVLTALTSSHMHADFASVAISKAKKNLEWLLLPVDFLNVAPEVTAKLESSVIKTLEKFKWG